MYLPTMVRSTHTHRLPQSFKHLPHVFNQVLKQDLEELDLRSTLIEHIDDIFCSPTPEQCHEVSMTILKKCALYKASLCKLQYCQPQVEYLGRIVAQGTRAIAASQLEGISKVPQLTTVS